MEFRKVIRLILMILASVASGFIIHLTVTSGHYREGAFALFFIAHLRDFAKIRRQDGWMTSLIIAIIKSYAYCILFDIGIRYFESQRKECSGILVETIKENK